MGQCTHRNRSVIGCHAAKLITGDECVLRAQIRRAERGEHTRRSRANDNDVQIYAFPSNPQSD